MIKTMRLVATNTIATTQTTNVSIGTGGEGGTYLQYNKMDVIAVVNTITSGNSVDITIKEWFATSVGSTTGFYLTTAKAVGVTSTIGAVFMTYLPNNQLGPYAVPGTQNNSMLNKGMQKQVITSTSGGTAALNVDVIFVYWN